MHVGEEADTEDKLEVEILQVSVQTELIARIGDVNGELQLLARQDRFGFEVADVVELFSVVDLHAVQVVPIAAKGSGRWLIGLAGVRLMEVFLYARGQLAVTEVLDIVAQAAVDLACCHGGTSVLSSLYGCHGCEPSFVLSCSALVGLSLQ